jgi:hypothetical protein
LVGVVGSEFASAENFARAVAPPAATHALRSFSLLLIVWLLVWLPVRPPGVGAADWLAGVWLAGGWLAGVWLAEVACGAGGFDDPELHPAIPPKPAAASTIAAPPAHFLADVIIVDQPSS